MSFCRKAEVPCLRRISLCSRRPGRQAREFLAQGWTRPGRKSGECRCGEVGAGQTRTFRVVAMEYYELPLPGRRQLARFENRIFPRIGNIPVSRSGHRLTRPMRQRCRGRRTCRVRQGGTERRHDVEVSTASGQLALCRTGRMLRGMAEYPGSYSVKHVLDLCRIVCTLSNCIIPAGRRGL